MGHCFLEIFTIGPSIVDSEFFSLLGFGCGPQSGMGLWRRGFGVGVLVLAGKAPAMRNSQSQIQWPGGGAGWARNRGLLYSGVGLFLRAGGFCARSGWVCRLDGLSLLFSYWNRGVLAVEGSEDLGRAAFFGTQGGNRELMARDESLLSWRAAKSLGRKRILCSFSAATTTATGQDQEDQLESSQEIQGVV